MFKMLGQLFGLLTSMFNSFEGATVALDNMVDETLVSSELSKVTKFNEYKDARAKLDITDDEVDALALRLRKKSK